jgi:hypothetical protein
MTEETFVRELERRADDVPLRPLDLQDVRTTAHRIRRRRRLAASGAAAAAVAAVLLAPSLGGSPSPDAPDPAPPVPTTTPDQVVPIGLDAPRGDPPRVLYQRVADDVAIDADGEEHALPDGTLQVVPYGEGYLAVAQGESPHESFKMHTLRLDADFTVVEDLGPSLDRVVVAADGARAAWTEVTGRTTVEVAVDDGSAVQRVELAAGEEPALVGFTDAGLVVEVRNADAEVLRLVGVTPDGATELPALLRAMDASADLVVGTTSYDGRFCGGAVRPGEELWEDCPYLVEDLSPDGRLVLGYPDEGTPANARLVVRDAGTGEVLVRYSGGRRAVVVEAAWEDDQHLLAVVEEAGRQAVLRLGLDGTVERTTDEVDAEPMSTTWFLAGRPFE